MKSLLWFLCIISSLQYVAAQISLVVSGPGTVRPTETLEMTCKVSGASLTDSTNMYGVHWVRQPDGKGLEWLGVIWAGGSTEYAQSLQGRITLTRDTNKGEVYLKLTGAKNEESGTYHCARERVVEGTARNSLDIWSQGVPLTVTSVATITPQVFPVVAFKGTPSTTTTFGCLTFYFPQPASSKIETSAGKELVGVKGFTSSLTGNPPTYSLFTEATVNDGEWKANAYKCHVKHYSSDIVKPIPNGCEAQPREPSVQLLQGTCPENNDGEIKVTCHVYNITSLNYKLQWYMNNQEKTLPQDQNELGKTQSDFYVVYSTVTISKAEWNNGVTVKCRATDLNTGKSAEDTIRKCSENFNCLGVSVFILPPSIEDLYVHKTARIRCVASNLKAIDESSTFKWSFPGAPASPNAQTEDQQLHDNGTTSVSSVLTVSPDLWNKHTEITCTYNNKELQTPIIVRIKKAEVTMGSPPVVNVISPSDEELTQKGMCSIVAMVSEINPKNIYLGWTKNNMEVSRELYVNSGLIRDTNGKYAMFSKLNIECNDWESGTTYGCVVGHESIPMNFIRRTIDKYSGKPTTVTMSVTVSDTTLSCY